MSLSGAAMVKVEALLPPSLEQLPVSCSAVRLSSLGLSCLIELGFCCLATWPAWEDLTGLAVLVNGWGHTSPQMCPVVFRGSYPVGIHALHRRGIGAPVYPDLHTQAAHCGDSCCSRRSRCSICHRMSR